MSGSEPQSPDQERLAALRRRIAAIPAPQIELQELPADTMPAGGQVWFTRIGRESDLENDPSPVMFLLGHISPEMPLSDALFDAVPMFDDVAHVGPSDMLLPAEIMGRSWAIALDQVITIDRDCLLTPLGKMPDAWSLEISSKVDADIQPQEENFLRGLPYLGEDDPRVEFHRELLRSTYGMQAAALARYEEAMTESELPNIIPLAPTPVCEAAHLPWGLPARSVAAKGSSPVKVAKFDLPGQDCFVEITAEKGTAWFVVFGNDDKRSPKLDHWLVMAGGTNVTEFSGARANCREDLLFGGFHLIAPDGSTHQPILRGATGNT